MTIDQRFAVAGATVPDDARAPGLTTPSGPTGAKARPGRLFRADAVVVVLAVVLALVGGFVATSLTPDSYETGAKVLFTPSQDVQASDAGQAVGLVAAQVPTWAALAETPAVVDDAVTAAGLDLTSTEAVEDVSATALAATSIIEVTASGSSAQDAAALTSATAASLVTQVEERSSVGGAPMVTGSVVEQPAVPTSPASPLLLVNLGVALAVGLAVGFGVVVARRALVARRRA